KVMERFLDRKLESDLSIWKGKQIVGGLRVEPKAITEKEMERTGADALVFSSGWLQIQLPGQQHRWLTLESTLAMTTNSEVMESTLTLSMNEIGLSLEIKHPAGTDSPTFLLRQGDRILLDSTKSNSGAEGSEGLMTMLLGS